MEPAIDAAERPADPISVDALDDFATVERTIDIRCASGDRTTATWRGVPVATLLEETAVPAETTHLIVASNDSYRGCLAVQRALQCLLAVARDGEPLEDADSPRLVGPGIEGIRTIKGVSTIEPVSLPPATDPEAFEAFKSRLSGGGSSE